MNKVEKFEHMQYVIEYPKQYEEGKRYPIIIFLHGAGTRGTDVKRLLGNPYFLITGEYQENSFITIAPLCSRNSWFDLFETLERFVCKISKESFTDSQRIYLMGASMGGYATWQLAMSMPEYFAAIVPICGGGMYWNASRLVNVPIWAFHGKKDQIVYVEESEKMVNAVRAAGGDAELTIYLENEHDAWSDTYRNPEVFLWMLSKRKDNKKSIRDAYIGSELYG